MITHCIYDDHLHVIVDIGLVRAALHKAVFARVVLLKKRDGFDTEFVVGEFPRKVAARLVAELGDPLVDEGLVVGVVSIHAAILGPGHIP